MRKLNAFPQALTIAGSCSGGSAGMQADLATFDHFHVYGTSVITAYIAENSYGVNASQTMPLPFINQEFKDLANDFKIRASKTGMLANSKLIDDVVKNYKEYDFGPLVVDPVIFTKNGSMLLEESAFKTLRDKLVPLATVITPNYFEAQKLTQTKINNDSDMLKSARKLMDMGAKNVMIKGKHDKNSATINDLVLLSSGKHFVLSGHYYNTKYKNGAGDTLSAGITSGLAKGLSVENSIKNAKSYVDNAISHPLNIAHAYGPINHFVK